MKPSWHRWWRLTAIVIDTCLLVIALGGAALLRYGPPEAIELARPSETSLSAPWLFAVPMWLASLAVFGLYNPRRWASAIEESRRIVAASFAAPTAFVLSSFLLKTSPSRAWVALAAVGGVASVGVSRRVLRRLGLAMRRRGRWMTRAVIVGRHEAKRLIETLMLDAGHGFLPTAVCGEVWGDLRRWSIDQVRLAAIETEASVIVILADDLTREEVQRTVEVADELAVEILIVPGLDYTLMHNLQLVPVANEPALAVEFPSLRVYQMAMKRVFDVVLSVIGLLLSAPVWLCIGIAIRRESRGPVLLRQRRIGIRGRPFEVVKFRTMVHGAHSLRPNAGNDANGLLFKLRDDPRVTKVGRFLRRSSLDELPQLWNVLRGDMSLVGPRPALPEEVEFYEAQLQRRLNVRPGLTGLWQVSGRSDLSFEEYVRLDLTYVQNWGLLLDVYLLFRTIPVVLTGRGAY